jgi:hypothetical protein
MDHKSAVVDCFHTLGVPSLLVVDLAHANHGFASLNWDGKGVSLQKLRKLMSSWSSEKPSIICCENYQWTEEEMQALEAAVTKFYIKSFYYYFHQAPIVPHGLSHSLCELNIVNTGHQITVDNPSPNIFYDTSVLLPL